MTTSLGRHAPTPPPPFPGKAPDTTVYPIRGTARTTTPQQQMNLPRNPSPPVTTRATRHCVLNI